MAARRRIRRGLAPIEMAFCLPILMLLLTVVCTVTSVCCCHAEVAVVARDRAWAHRHQPWEVARPQPAGPDRDGLVWTAAIAAEVPGRITQILGPRPQWPANRGLVASASREVPVFTRSFAGILPPAQSEHVTLAGTWDHQEIQFEAQSDHPRLQPTRKFHYFTRLHYDFSVFRTLSRLRP
jgi:hypothetical protein